MERVADFLVAATFGLSSTFGVEVEIEMEMEMVLELCLRPPWINDTAFVGTSGFRRQEGRDHLSVRLHDWAAGQTRKYIQALLST